MKRSTSRTNESGGMPTIVDGIPTIVGGMPKPKAPACGYGTLAHERATAGQHGAGGWRGNESTAWRRCAWSCHPLVTLDSTNTGSHSECDGR